MKQIRLRHALTLALGIVFVSGGAFAKGGPHPPEHSHGPPELVSICHARDLRLPAVAARVHMQWHASDYLGQCVVPPVDPCDVSDPALCTEDCEIAGVPGQCRLYRDAAGNRHCRCDLPPPDPCDVTNPALCTEDCVTPAGNPGICTLSLDPNDPDVFDCRCAPEPPPDPCDVSDPGLCFANCVDRAGNPGICTLATNAGALDCICRPEIPPPDPCNDLATCTEDCIDENGSVGQCGLVTDANGNVDCRCAPDLPPRHPCDVTESALCTETCEIPGGPPASCQIVIDAVTGDELCRCLPDLPPRDPCDVTDPALCTESCEIAGGTIGVCQIVTSPTTGDENCRCVPGGDPCSDLSQCLPESCDTGAVQGNCATDASQGLCSCCPSDCLVPDPTNPGSLSCCAAGGFCTDSGCVSIGPGPG
jgi:hypothetical protein